MPKTLKTFNDDLMSVTEHRYPHFGNLIKIMFIFKSR